MSREAFRVRGLSKRFGATTVVDRVDFAAAEGQFTCLVGPSGCGKSTLLRLLIGLETPSEGVIEAAGQDITRLPPAKRAMGMVFQSYALFPNMRVADNIAFGMPRGGSAAARAERVQALLQTVGLPGMERRYPGQLSGGQQQRVAIARALAGEPRILLLDEPLSALDPQVREQLRDELKSLQRRLGVTTVMVTHDQAEALAVADVILVMKAGRIEQAGAPEAVYDRPVNPFVAGFLGAANLLAAEAVSATMARLAGGQALGFDGAALTPGARLTLSIRPHFVRLAPGEGLTGRVHGETFTGSVVRLDVVLDGDPAQTVMAELAASEPRPAIGEPVRIVLPAERLQLFARPEEAAA